MLARLRDNDPELVRLDLNLESEEVLGPEQYAVLAMARDQYPERVELWLDGKGVGDAGATAIAEGLKTNSTLQTLNLGDNKVGDAGAAALFGSGAPLRKLSRQTPARRASALAARATGWCCA